MSRKTFSLGEIAAAVNGELTGDSARPVNAVQSLTEAGASDLSYFAGNAAFLQDFIKTRAGAVLVSARDAEQCPVAAIVVADPYLAYAQAAQQIYPQTGCDAGISTSALIAANAEVSPQVEVGDFVVIGERAKIAQGVVIGAHCRIADDAEIAAGTRLEGGVTIGRGVKIGQRGHILSGAVIGEDGFGFAPNPAGDRRWEKIPQIGSVVIGDDVHIGANTCIDRGAIGDTIIGDGVIMDNLIQIAHNVKIGRNTAVAGCAAIAGSTEIGENCLIAGRAAIVGHLNICDGVQIDANSLVTKSIDQPGEYSSAWPAQPVRRWRRLLSKFRRQL